MRPLAAFPLALLLLTGCISGNDANVYGSPFGQRVEGNAMGVMVGNVWNEMDAFPVAEAHCARYGKSARLSSSGGYKASFDCV